MVKKLHTLFQISIVVLLCRPLLAQPGCQDPAATNYNPNATSTNASCTYTTTQAPLANKIASFPDTCKEASSLLYTDGRMFTNNDSGNKPILFQLDTLTGAVLKYTTISNYNNEDWEDLAADSLHVYIGEFGNNSGDRTNLKVLKVKKSALYNPDSTSIKAVAIKFNYPDQTSFVSSSTHNFDCEAFFYHKGLLHLFSKNRGNLKTKHYTLNPNLAMQTAVLKDSLNTNGLITSATIRSDGKVATLLGYNSSNGTVFSWLLFGFDSTNYFGGNRRRLELPNALFTGQAEGIGFRDEYRLWVSNEKLVSPLGTVIAKMKQLNVKPYLQSFFTDVQSIVVENQMLAWPNPTRNLLEIGDGITKLTFWDATGKEMKYEIIANAKSASTANWPSGLYLMKGVKNGKAISTKILKE